MSSRFGNVGIEVLKVESVKRQRDFEEQSSLKTESEFFRVSTRTTKRSRRLDFEKNDPSVLLRFPDLEDQIAFQSEALRPSTYRIIFSAMQKEKLEAMFLKTNYPSRAEKATLAATLNIRIDKVQTWFNNRRQKWKKQQKKAMGPSARSAVLPRVSLVKRSYKNTTSLECYSQFPRQRQEQSQPPSSAPYQATVSFALSPQTTQSSATCNQIYSQECQPKLMTSQRHFSSKQHPVPNLPVVVETISPPYSLFPHLMQRIPQPHPDAYPPCFHATDSSGYTVQQPEPSQTTCQPMEVFQASKAEFTPLADEFPFSCAIAKEMPHIFGEIEDDEVLGCPLTPPFECSSDLALRREFVLRESCQFSSLTTDLSNRVSPTQNEIPRIMPDSYRFGGNGVQPSNGFMSEGRSFRFYRHH